MLRNDSETESEEEGEMDPIDNEDGNSEVPERDPDAEISDWFEAIYAGIMVVRSEEEHFTPETEKKDEAEATAGADAEKKADDKGDEETKVKKVLRRYFRTYFPAWKGSYKGRLYYEDFIEIKEPSSTAKAAETLLMTE